MDEECRTRVMGKTGDGPNFEAWGFLTIGWQVVVSPVQDGKDT